VTQGGLELSAVTYSANGAALTSPAEGKPDYQRVSSWCGGRGMGPELVTGEARKVRHANHR